MNNSKTGFHGETYEIHEDGKSFRLKSDLYQVGSSWFVKLPGEQSLVMIKITDVTEFTFAFVTYDQIHEEASERWQRYKKSDVELVEPIE